MAYSFDNFQIPQTGVAEPNLADQTRSDSNTTIRRAVDMKISNFGALSVGAIMASDYTRVNLGFKSKDDLADWSALKPEWQFAERNENPLIAGSTVKYTRDDQFIRMGMSSVAGAQIDEPNFDVMDTDLTTAEGIVAFTTSPTGVTLNWPSEGFRTFGGKYDFLPYVG